jgi:uncharacterized protein (DUF924 family)
MTPAAAVTVNDLEQVVRFWQEAGPRLWFAKDNDFDRRFRERFLAAHEAAARGELDHALETPNGALGLLLLLDQFPRNAFRGTPRMYATDAQARQHAERALALSHDQSVPPDLRLFFYLPFGHSEDLSDQERCVALNEKLGAEPLEHALGHRDIIRRFGRFPHRNAILGRPSTAEELEFLAQGGFAG